MDRSRWTTGDKCKIQIQRQKTIQSCKEWVDDKRQRRQETNAKYEDKKQFNYAKSGWTKYNQRHMQNTKTKHLCKEWVHDRMQSQRRKKSQCAGLTRSGWTSTAQSSPCPACPTSAPSSFSFSTLPRCSFISIAATQNFISPWFELLNMPTRPTCQGLVWSVAPWGASVQAEDCCSRSRKIQVPRWNNRIWVHKDSCPF